MMSLELSAGEIVCSKAGRDKGRYFVVMETVDAHYVLLCDGDLRRVDKPKKKKIRHLEPTHQMAEFVKSKLAAGVRVTNPDLKKSLDSFRAERAQSS